MAVDQNGQLYFTFEEEMARIQAHIDYLSTKVDQNNVDSVRFVARFIRIVKSRTRCLARVNQLLKEGVINE